MCETFSCGYVRAAILKSAKENNSANLGLKTYELMTEQFGDIGMPVNIFTARMRAFLKAVKKKKWKADKKDIYISYFSLMGWNSLENEERLRHTIKNCMACSDFHGKVQCSFLDISKSTPKKNVLQDVTNTTTPKTPSPAERKEAMNLLDRASEEWNTGHSTPFTKVITSVKRSGLEERKTGNEKLTKLRRVQREVKLHEQNLWKENNRDLKTFLATRQSLNSRRKQRRSLFYHRPAVKTKQKITKKRHTKHHSQLQFKKFELLEYVKSLSPTTPIVLSELGRRFGVPGNPRLVNVIVKELLQDHGVNNISLLPSNRKRRSEKNKMPHGTGISVATPRTEEELIAALKKGIEDGEFLLGDLIEPKTFKKLIVDENGSREVSFTISGRKIPLIEIRKKMNERLQRVLRQGQIKRFLSVWSDHSSILSHGYLLLTVKPMYASETFYSSQEMRELFSINIDVQQLVETPHLYLFACCKDSISEKLCYAETRLDDIRDLTIETNVDGSHITDVVRWFHGDHPEISFEAGTSQGGTYPCICPCSVDKFNDIEFALRNSVMSLESRRAIAVSGPAGRKERTNPFGDISKEELVLECEYREIDTFRKDGKKPTKEDLKRLLKAELKGITRVPTLFYKNATVAASDISLGEYEVSPSEPLHDIKGHIANLWAAMKDVLSDSQNTKFEETLEACYGSKDKKTGADYRASTIHVYNFLSKICSPEVKELLYTLVVLSKLAYQPAENRCTKTVLQMYNVSFRHACVMVELFGRKWCSSKVSNNKFYGLYFHSIMTHFAELTRIVPLSSLHAEEEERTFSTINSISLNTSDRKMESVRDNSIVRLQAERDLKDEEESQTSWKSMISKLDASFDGITRSSFDLSTIDKRLWQAHVERIADFLLVGEDHWWHREGNIVVFHDGDQDPLSLDEGPKLMSFTEYSMQTAKEEVDQCWKMCLEANISLPVSTEVSFDETGKYLSEEVHFSTMANNEGDNEGIEEQELEEIVNIPTPVSTVQKAPPPFKFKSSLTTSIYELIGMHQLLRDFDKSHCEFKEQKYATALKQCQKILPKLLQEVRKCREMRKVGLKKWEESFFLKYNREPIYSDIEMEGEAKSAYEFIRKASEVIRAVDIPVKI